MLTFVARRFVRAVPTLLGVSLFVFLLLHLTGDPAAVLFPPDTPVEVRQEFARHYGLDQPLPIQYARLVERALHGDFGRSLRYRTDALGLIVERLPATFELTFASLLIALAVGIPLGIVAAVRRNSFFDYMIRATALVGQAIPSFYLGLVLVLVMAVWLNLLPSAGRDTPRHLILPAITLAIFLIPLILRITRGAILDELSQNYVRTAHAKGLVARSVLTRHVLKNALIPIATVVGLAVGSLLSGAIVTETVFAWPGVGRLLVEAIYTRDFPLVQAGVMVVASAFIVVNLLVDVLYGWLDPRIRYS